MQGHAPPASAAQGKQLAVHPLSSLLVGTTFVAQQHAPGSSIWPFWTLAPAERATELLAKRPTPPERRASRRRLPNGRTGGGGALAVFAQGHAHSV